ncbi:hypothetical protein [Wolbachia endosymbiont of Ctenocephalides felis wCfeT]|uniref:hypothetical protein n=1 Tax=Wolbachia endosymbiont of Ctenocephalides felis wCfeT TaxID=2732593 RepID=UPI001446B9A3|nr:hypothetical protein [Wolbachia endosymbiont of Ctenocephalides felis wCfeT]
MSETQKKSLAWLLIVLLLASYITVSNIIFFRMNQQENENNVQALSESMNEFKMLFDMNQSRIEKKIHELKRSMHNQCEQTGDGSSRNLAKLMLHVVKMKNSLLKDEKFNNHINTIKPLVSELDDSEIENAVNELENLKEISTLHELKFSFEKTIDTLRYCNSTLFQKAISNWVKIENKNDPLRVKFSEIEESINDNDWQNIASTVSDLTYPEFKPWLNKLNDFTKASQNISTIYHHLLQYIS